VSDTVSFSCIRVKQLTNDSEAGAMAKHGRREIGAKHVDASRTHLNRFYVSNAAGELVRADDAGRDVVGALKAVQEREKAVQRKGSYSPGTHMILVASPGFFEGDADGRKLEAWVDANLDWVRKRFPKMAAAARLDLDEATTHMDVFLVPLNRRRTKRGKAKVEISHRAVFSAGRGPKSYALLQDEYAAAMAPFGLKRGAKRVENQVRREHMPPAIYREIKAAELEQREAIVRTQETTLAAIANGDVVGAVRTLHEEGLLFSHTTPKKRRDEVSDALRPYWSHAVECAAAFFEGMNRNLRSAALLLSQTGERLRAAEARRLLKVPVDEATSHVKVSRRRSDRDDPER